MKLKLKDIFPLRTQTCCQPSCAWSKRSMDRVLKLWRWRCDVEWRSSRTNIFIHDSLRYFTLADAVELSKKVSSGPCYMWTDISGHPLTDYLASKISANTTCVSSKTAALLRISLFHHQANFVLKACSVFSPRATPSWPPLRIHPVPNSCFQCYPYFSVMKTQGPF